MRQHVSSAACTTADVVHLEEMLDISLQQRQARETGICPVRRELYTQFFGKGETSDQNHYSYDKSILIPRRYVKNYRLDVFCDSYPCMI